MISAKFFRFGALMAGLIGGMLICSQPAATHAATIGKTFDEIVKAAAKEGKVRIGSGLT